MFKLKAQRPPAVRMNPAASSQRGPARSGAGGADVRAGALRPLDERTPLYMGLITVSSALAAVTQLWAGVASFGLMVLVYEGLHRWYFRLTR